MKISCQSCQSKYNVADEKVQGKVVKIRCRKCGATIVVDGNAPAGANGSGAAGQALGAGGGEAGGDGQWHVNVSETDQRSMTLAELVDAYNGSVVNQETFIWTDGMDDWRPLGEVEAVVAALHAAASGGGGQAEAQEQHGYGQETGGEREDAPTQAFSYDQAAAAGYDLPFDGQQAAQAAAAPAPEPRRAAVVKPRGRDLFGEGGGGDEVQTSAPSMAQAQSMARGAAAAQDASSSMTGERNENSVLFSLAALTKNSGPADVPPPPAGSKDDSGLIDLKALAMKTQSSRPVAPKADGDLFSAPLGFTPPPLGAPLGALGSPLGADAEPKSKLPLLIGGGIGVLVLMVLSVVVTLKLAGGPVPAPSASVAAAPAAPTATATAEAAPSASAEASAAASASAAPTAAPKPKAAGGGGGGAVHAGGGGATPKAAAAAGGAATPAATSAAPVQTAAPKKASGCEAACAGDLMCLMKCSTH
jgi:predicted Zn finger-like uncharacterized protein